MAIPQIITQASGSLSIPFLTPTLRVLSYEANALMPIEIPGADELVNAALNGFIDGPSAVNLLKRQGIKVKEWNEKLWNYAKNQTPLGELDLNPQYIRYVTDLWGSVIRNRLYTPSIDECGFLLRRKLITEPLYNYMVAKQCNNNDMMANAWKQSTYEIPGPQDLVRFAVREAYNPELITLFGYNKEVPVEVLPWMEKQGYGGTTGLSIPPGGTDGDNNPRLGDATWLDLYWWSHWELPSLTQGYEMLHRLYPSSDFGPSPLANDRTRFTPEELEKLQKAQDIPEYWRQKLQAVSYRPIHKADGEYMYEWGLITQTQLYHIFRQEGYSDNDCKLLISMTDLRRKQNLKIDPGQQSLQYVCEYYKLGLVSEQDAITMLQKSGYNADDTSAFIAKCKLEIKGETVKSTIKTLEQAYYRGIYSYEEIRIELLKNGLNPVVTDYWLVRWKYNRDIRYKPASAKQNLTAFKNGVLTEANLVSRLFNLGYDGNSINIMVANQKSIMMQAQIAALQKQAKALAQQKKAAAAEQAKAAKKAAKKQQDDAKIVTNQANKRLRAFIRTSSDANIKAWYKDKLITLWELYYRLFYKGYIIADAEKWVTANFPDIPQGDKNAATKKASSQFRNEGNYLE